MDFDRLIPIIRRLALEAGDRIMEVYNGPEFEVKSKSDASPVTEADEAADAIISAGLRAAFPDVVLITEEQAASHALTAQTFLIVDPLDGTTNFLHGFPTFAVSIAAEVRGRLEAAVVLDVMRQEFFTASRGAGAQGGPALGGMALQGAAQVPVGDQPGAKVQRFEPAA